MIIKSVAVNLVLQDVINYLNNSGTTLEEQGVNSSLGYLSIILSIMIGVVAILGCLITIKDVEVKDLKIGPIILLLVVALTWIGIFIPLIDTSFTVSSYTFYIEIDLVETLMGIGEPIILTVALVLTVLATYVLSD